MNYKIFIYKIWWEDKDDLYVGSTKQKLSYRMRNHRADCNRNRQYKLQVAMREYGYDFNYIILKSYNVSCREEQMKKEQKWINKLKPNLNKNNPVNQMTKSEYDKIYKEKNKERIKKNHKIWRDNNRDIVNKVVKCECGEISMRSNLARHKRSKKHQRNLISTN